MKIKVTGEREIEATPRLLAEIFWGMNSLEQADFFHELGGVVEEDHLDNPNSYSHGEMQWLGMTQAIKERGKQAQDIFLSFSAFAYEFWPQKDNLGEDEQ